LEENAANHSKPAGCVGHFAHTYFIGDSHLVTKTVSKSYLSKHYINGSLYQAQSYPASRTLTTQVTQKSGVANWKRKLRQGEDATSTFVAQEEYGAAVNGTGFEVKWSYAPDDVRISNLTGCVPDIPEPPTIALAFSDEDIAKALIRLYDKIKSEKTAMSGGTFLGEFAETVRMLRRPLMGLRDGLSNYRDVVRLRAKGIKAVKGRLKALNRMISSTWLEIQFGMKPLMADIDDICDEITRKVDQSDTQLITLKGANRREKTRYITYFTGQPYGYYPIAGRYETRVVDEVTVVYRCGYKRESDVYKVKPFAEAVRDRFGFNMEDFVPTVWNLIPTSFVADYFSSVGGILQASFTDTSGVTWCNRTVICKATYLQTTWPDEAWVKQQLTGYQIHSMSGKTLGTAVAFRKTVDRRSVGLDLPPLVFYTPPVDSLKWLNLAALTSSFLTLSSDLRR
jgi:hypothetical protein